MKKLIVVGPDASEDQWSANNPVAARLTVSVIIVNYNTREMTLNCLRAINADLAGIPAEIWLVDNASCDGSAGAVAAEMPHVRIIANQRNVGFGAANNLAMKQAAGNLFLLLNTDAFVRPGAVRTLVNLMDDDPRIGVAGPRLLNSDKSLQVSCFRFPSPVYAWTENLWVTRMLPSGWGLGDYRKWPHDRPRDVDWIVGACMIVRRDAYEAVGGFDERFFMYAEETDWQRRIRAAGWRIQFTPDAQVVHLGRGSAPKNDSPGEQHFFRSLDEYELKHHGAAGLVSLRSAMVVGSAMRAALWAALGVCRASRRRDAWARAAFHGRLLIRQATRVPRRAGKELAP